LAAVIVTATPAVGLGPGELVLVNVARGIRDLLVDQHVNDLLLILDYDHTRMNLPWLAMSPADMLDDILYGSGIPGT
jgi:hypothetical protein